MNFKDQITGRPGSSDIRRVPAIRAMARIYQIGHNPEASPWKSNLTLYDWASAQVMMLQRRSEYGIAGFYFEFQNVASPGDPADIPGYGRTGGISYYNDLSSSPDKDYLRVKSGIATIYNEDATRYSLGNVVRFFGVSEGETGVHGKEFSEDANSVIMGVAVVVMPDDGDPTQDIVYGRYYPTEEEQQPKQANRQIGVQYDLAFA